MTNALIAAREAAADFLQCDGHAFDKLWSHQVRAGGRDGHILVQHFHRAILAAEARGAQRERVVEYIGSPDLGTPDRAALGELKP